MIGAAAIDDEEDDMDSDDLIPNQATSFFEDVPKEELAAIEREEDELDAEQDKMILSCFKDLEAAEEKGEELAAVEDLVSDIDEPDEDLGLGVAEEEANEPAGSDDDDIFQELTPAELAAQEAAEAAEAAAEDAAQQKASA